MRKSSYIAALALVRQLEPSVAMRRFPVRQADFFVLQAPDVPSMLIELGFLSNSDDIINLESADWRDKMVKTIGQGIESYFIDLNAGGAGG
jgi:N-acetylmuramoyl-L-alanine amidase